MSRFMEMIWSLSVSGTLVLLLVFLLKTLYRNKFSRRWQYYIWLIVAFKFLVPFSFGTVNTANLFTALHALIGTNENPANPDMRDLAHADPNRIMQAPVHTNSNEITQMPANAGSNETMQTPANVSSSETMQMPANVSSNETTQMPTSADFSETTQMPVQTGENIIPAPAAYHPPGIQAYLFFAWLLLALFFLIRKIIIYQRFIRYMKARNIEISDIKTLNILSDCKDKLKIKTRVELYRNALAASPIMTGFFHPSIILPAIETGESAFPYIFAHELLHYKRRDMFFKWFIQIVICLHWFNPFVYLLEKEVNRACELSCDEAVISIFGSGARRAYGDTLISFVKSAKLYKNSFASFPLSEGAKQLKERLGAIMNFKKKTKTTRILTGILTLCIITGSAFIGGYPAAAATRPNTASDALQTTGEKNKNSRDESSSVSKSEQDGKNEKTGDGRDSKEKETEDGQDGESKNLKNDGDNKNSGSDQNQEEKENWNNEDWDFDWDWDDEDWDDDWDWDDEDWDDDWDWDDKALLDSYASYGIVKNGKLYYYQGELVNIIKDQRPDSSFYMLHMNSKGTASIKVIRNTEGEITEVSYMTEEEVEKLLGKAVGKTKEILLVNTKEWDCSAFLTVEAYYETDNVYILPGTTDKIILKEYLTEDQSSYHARTEVKDNALIIRSGDRPTTDYSSYIEIYVPSAALLHVKVSATSGNIEINDYAGTMELSTVSGCIDVSDSNITGNIDTISGCIDVFDSDITGNISTTSGCIDVFDSDMAGNIDTFSGEITFSPTKLSGDLYITSYSGNIFANFPASIACNLKAKTSTGKLEGSYFTGKSKRKKEFSKTIGKNPKFTVALETSLGNIDFDLSKSK